LRGAKRLRGAAEANPEIPRFPFASLWASALNKLRNLRRLPFLLRIVNFTTNGAGFQQVRLFACNAP